LSQDADKKLDRLATHIDERSGAIIGITAAVMLPDALSQDADKKLDRLATHIDERSGAIIWITAAVMLGLLVSVIVRYRLFN
jgi:hypothetical protein